MDPSILEAIEVGGTAGAIALFFVFRKLSNNEIKRVEDRMDRQVGRLERRLDECEKTRDGLLLRLAEKI